MVGSYNFMNYVQKTLGCHLIRESRTVIPCIVYGEELQFYELCAKNSWLLFNQRVKNGDSLHCLWWGVTILWIMCKNSWLLLNQRVENCDSLHTLWPAYFMVRSYNLMNYVQKTLGCYLIGELRLPTSFIARSQYWQQGVNLNSFKRLSQPLKQYWSKESTMHVEHCYLGNFTSGKHMGCLSLNTFFLPLLLTAGK